MGKSDDFIYSLSKFDNVDNFKKLVNIRVEKGYVVALQAGPDQVREWAFQGFRIENNTQVLYGGLENSRDMVPLSEVLGYKKEEALSKLLLLAEAVAVLSKTPSCQYEIGLDLVFFTPKNEVVFLPATLFRKMREMAQEDYGKTHLLINNPYFLKQNERAIWALETLCYRVLTGAFPFEAQTASQLKDRMRQKGSSSPFLYMPELRPEIARQFQDFFNSHDVCTLALVHVVKNLQTWIKEGFVAAISENQRREMTQRSTQEKILGEKKLQLRLFWEKNWKTYVFGIGLVIVIGGLLGFYFATTVFRPRVTKGFVPEKVMDVYFQSLNTLNVTDMSDCVTGEAEKHWSDSLTILAPTSRQFEAMTGKPMITNAAEWVREGKPAIAPPRYAFGAVNLLLTQEAGEPEPVFRAEYDMYYRDVDPDSPGNKDLYQLVFRVKERFYLRQDSGDWVIFRIETMENKLVEKKKAVLE